MSGQRWRPIGRCTLLLVLLLLAAACGEAPLSLPSANAAPTPTVPPATLPAARTAPQTHTPSASPTLPPTASPTQIPDPTPTHTPTTTPTPTVPAATATQTHTPTPRLPDIVYQPAFGIDYAHPENYLSQGEQSQIADTTALDPLRTKKPSLAHLGQVYRWLKREFAAYRAGGQTIGVVTVNDLLAERRLGGCHDHGLVYAAVARELGYPAVMVRTISIAWAEGFQAGKEGPHVGHVFVEVYVGGKWVLIDSTNGWYVPEGYNPADPVIPITGNIAGVNVESKGFYVERKGIDTWGFGIHSPAESTQAMDELGRQLDLGAIVYPDYTFLRYEK